MKRTLALVLALIMILCMIPASMLTAFARGRGVYANTIPNQTIDGAPGQYIPETVVVDGELDDTGWREDDWKRVNSESGTWNVQYPTKNQTINNEAFSYKYNVRKDYYYLYGAFAVPTDEAGLVKLWLNNDAGENYGYSHLFTFDITGKVSGGVAAYSGNGTWTRVDKSGNTITDKSDNYFEKSKVVFKEDGEFTNIEFKVLLADFCPERNPKIDYFVSVDTKVAISDNEEHPYEALYHPAIEIDEEFPRDSHFPSTDPETWESQYAGEITTEDLNGLDDDSFKSDITINGEFDEAEWAQHTDFYSRWYERTNVVEYKDNANFKKPYSDLSNNVMSWSDWFRDAAEHDVRIGDNYIYGAALVYFEDGNEDIVAFSLYDKKENGTYDQLYIKINGNGTLNYAVYYPGGSYNNRQELTSDYVKVGRAVVGAPGMFSYEFVVDRRVDPNFDPYTTDQEALANLYLESEDKFLPEYYDIRLGRDTAEGEAYCAFRWAIDAEWYNNVAPDYDDTLSGLYYKVRHFNNRAGLDAMGATDTPATYYKPYALYTPDGYLGVKAWTGLTPSAGGPVNADWIKADEDARIENLHYLHSLRADYEFVYGALSVQAEAGSAFKEWKHGEEDSPAGGDYFTLWVQNPGNSSQIFRFDLWTYKNPIYDEEIPENGPEYLAQIGGYSKVDGVVRYSIATSKGAKAAFVNRENAADKTRYYAFEYSIALSSCGIDKLDVKEDITEQPSEYRSTAIFEYYTSLSVANENKTAYNTMLWPRSGNNDNDENALPGDGTFLWNKQSNSNGIKGNPQVLRYQDVIRALEPDGRIVEELRFDLDDINFSNSEYRDISKHSNFFTAKENFYVGRDYAYLLAEIDGNVSADNTAVILWIKNSKGIHKYKFGHNGSNCTLTYTGSSNYSGTLNDQYDMEFTNGKTYFEAIIDMDRFGADERFEYYVEIQQRVNGETLSRVFSDGVKKIELPTIDYGSQINTVKAWYQNAGHIEDLIHFPREEITIDGNLNDNGWDKDEWVRVSTDVNANLQEADTHYDAFKTDFYYQLRVDDEHLYVAAVIFYSDRHPNDTNADGVKDYNDTLVPATSEAIKASNPGFRIWLKSGNEGTIVSEGNSRTYTDYYGMSMDANGNVKFGSYKNIMPTYPNNTRNLYNKDYAPVKPRYENGQLVKDNDGKVMYDYDPNGGMQTYYPRSYGDTTYPSDLFGYTQYAINEQEANVNANESVVLKGEAINPEDYEENGMLDEDNTKDKVEQGVMRFGNQQKYESTFNNGRIRDLGGDSMVVEFRVKLEEFGGHDEFQYMVTTSTTNSWGGTRTTMYPAITSEAGSRDNYFHYYYPYWHWVDGTSVTVTDEVRADMTLLTYKRPVVTLGAKVSKTYMYQGNETNALRMGGLWEEKYIRKTKELAAKQWADGVKRADGYWPDKDGKPNWVDYWDVKAMGMVVIPTHLLEQNSNPNNLQTPGKYDLFKGTKYSVWMDADGIVGWRGKDESTYPNNNYADYKNFAFYVTVVNIPAYVNFCFRGFVDYYDEVLDACPSYYDVILERSIDMVIDSAIRTGDSEKDEEDNALPGGDFSRDDESGFTGTDGSDYENSNDSTGDITIPGIQIDESGASLDFGYPIYDHAIQVSGTWKKNKSLVFADSSGDNKKLSSFYEDGATKIFPGNQLDEEWKKLVFVENADGTLTLKKIYYPNDSSYGDLYITKGMMVVAYHPDHSDAALFNSYEEGDTFVLEGLSLEEIGATKIDAELKTLIKKAKVCNHSFTIPETCDKARTCALCGIAQPGSYPLEHTYSEDAKRTCIQGINCTACGDEKEPPLGHDYSDWKQTESEHYRFCNRADCDMGEGAKLDLGTHTFKNGVCSVCEYECEHSGAEFHEEVPAQCEIAGVEEYYECPACNLMFSDADCTQQITEPVIIPALEHEYDEDNKCELCGKSKFKRIQLDLSYPSAKKDNNQVLVFAFSNYDEAPEEYSGPNHTLRAFSGAFPTETGALADYALIALDLVGTDKYALSTKWKVVAIDTSGEETYLEGLGEYSGGFNTRTDLTWNIGSVASANGGHRIVIAVPKSNDSYSTLSLLDPDDTLMWSGDMTYYAAGSCDNDTVIPETYLVLDCDHNWIEADCDTPDTCSKCDATRGDALGHDWIDADCDTPKTCDRCGETEGDALGHDWVDADCVTAKYCNRCDETEGEALGHSWVDATCSAPKHCTVCNETEGKALGHTPGAAATCTTAQTCTVCGTELAGKLPHTPGDDATCTTAQTCTECGTVLNEKLGHDLIKVDAKEATCTESGNSEYHVCKRCEKYFSDENGTEEITDKESVVIDALGHNYEDAEWQKDDASHWRVCQNEGCDRQDSLEAHDYDEPDGNGYEYCSLCEYKKIPVTLQMSYLNIPYEDYYDAARYEDYESMNYIWASSSTDHAKILDIAGTSINGAFQWHGKLLLEYDEHTKLYRVIEKEEKGEGFTDYNGWYVGYDRIALTIHADSLQYDEFSKVNVGDYFSITEPDHEIIKAAGQGPVNITFTKVPAEVESIPPEVTEPKELDEFTTVNNKVAYIPLDDRPVHTTRVQYEAAAAGINLLMPTVEEADYRTIIDKDRIDEHCGGKTDEILEWLKDIEGDNGGEDQCDYYVISLDQVFSGGLTNSRHGYASYDGHLSPEDLEAAEFLVELSKNNYVVFTETLMRLAVTQNYKTGNSNLYQQTRDYGKAERKQLSGEALTLENVVSGYRYGTDGLAPVSFTNGTTISPEDATNTINARERKLRITDYIIRHAGQYIDHLFIGCDDSSSGRNVQANDKDYLNMLISTYGINGTVFAGADEMGLMGIATLASFLYTPEENLNSIPAKDENTIGKVPVNVVYYGIENSDKFVADIYDYDTLENSVNLHLKAIGAYQVAEADANNPEVLQILVLTRGIANCVLNPDQLEASQGNVRPNALKLAQDLEGHLNANRPVCLIDGSNNSSNNLNNLMYGLREQGVFNRTDITKVLGYSQWNTVGNAVGIALSNAVARYSYIMNANQIDEDTNIGFLKALTFAFVKDSAYKASNPSSVGGWNLGTTTSDGFTGNILLGYINGSTQILGKNGSITHNYTVSIENIDWPDNWNRAYECWFDVVVN